MYIVKILVLIFQMLFAAVDLGVFEELDKFGTLCAADVAKQIEADKDATERLLNACASIGLLSKDENGKTIVISFSA